MNIRNWFKKNNKELSENEQVQLHVAGATVRHQSDFKNLESFKNHEALDQKFIDKWVKPYYFELDKTNDKWVEHLIKIKADLTDEIILKNLGDFNWRTRQTGAFFSSICDKKEFTEIIGVHLVKSEVCYAGMEYAKALASFNSDESISYLEQYLRYYLLQKDLEFDQKPVMVALKYVDEINGTNRIGDHLENWEYFISDKRAYQLARIEKRKGEGAKEIEIEQLKQYLTWLEDFDTTQLRKQIEVIQKIKSS